MDETDLAILQQLLINCRSTNREIAETTNLSVSAVHKRIKALEEDHVISAYTARPSIMALNSIPVVVIGRTTSTSMDNVQKRVGEHENVFAIAIASGKMMYISAMLRNISELQDFSTSITKLGELEDAMIGIVNVDYAKEPLHLSDIEMRIIKSLNRNGRKSFSDIGLEIGSSAKTTRKYIEAMIEENKALFSIEWAPLYRDSFVSVIHIEVPTGTDVNELTMLLYQKYQKNVVICANFGNIPNFILLEIWTQSPRENQKIIEQLQESGFKDITPHILLSISWHTNWMDKMLQDRK